MAQFVLTAQLQLQAPNNVSQVVSQIQNQLNGINVNVNVQGSAKAQQQIQQLTQTTNQATGAANRMGQAFAVSIRRFAAFSIATRAVGLFTSTLSDAISQAIDFERQLIKVVQVTGDSADKIKKLTSTITGLSTGFGVSSQSLLEVSTALLQAGISSKDTEVALKSLAKAALAPNFDSLSETTEGAIAILAQFKQGVGALEGQLSSINAVAGAFAVEAADLIDVVRRAGGVFKSSGGSLNELLALFTSVRATTRESAESIGTGLRTIFTRIQRPETIEFLKRFGVELLDLEGKFVGPYEAIRRLSDALAGLGERDITFIKIAEELGGFRQIGKVLPLLQQFSTAESALNVAMKANNSLSQDAVTAQAALAVRIMKVKEEFAALVRGITETSTFQIMANTALSLASALIKVADSIKPLLPLLTAVAAFKAIKGIGSFIGGVGAGLASGRTFNSGGRVYGFARGGLVPGSGNGDTVPAMLSPGEFVIRKSSVAKLGAENLAAMNENKFAKGGLSTAEKIQAARSQIRSQNVTQNKTKEFNTGTAKSTAVQFAINPGSIGAFFMNPAGLSDKPVPFKDTLFNLTNSKLAGLSGIQGKSKGFRQKEITGLLKSGTISTFFPSLQDISKGSFGELIQQSVKKKLGEAVIDASSVIENQIDSPLNGNKALLKSRASQRIQNDLGAIRTTSGYLFEGVIDALTGANPASNQSAFDFPASSLQGNRKRLSALFGPIGKLGQADAKASYSSKIIDGGQGSIVSKIINSINNGNLSGIRMLSKGQKFATGGDVGTDTIPALLTPGEFVVNRSAAQKIGYGNLSRMNRVGKYANGGVVKYFEDGGGSSDVPYTRTKGKGLWPDEDTTSSGGANTSNLASSSTAAAQAVNAQTSAIKNNTATTKTSTSVQAAATKNNTAATKTSTASIFENRFAQISMATSLMSGMLPAIDENSSALMKNAQSMLSMVSTITMTIAALQGLAAAAGLKDLAGLFAPLAKLLPKNVTGAVSSTVSNATRGLNAGVKGAFYGGQSGSQIANTLASRGVTPVGQTAAKFGASIGSKSAIASSAGSLGLGIGFSLVNSAMDDFIGHQKTLNKAMEEGNADLVYKKTLDIAGADAMNTLSTATMTLASAFGPPGVALAGLTTSLLKAADEFLFAGELSQELAKGLNSVSVMFGGKTLESQMALNAAQAQGIATQKALDQGAKDSAKGLEDFNKGTISASELLSFNAAAGMNVEKQTAYNEYAVSENEKNKSGLGSTILREIGAYATLGYVDTAADRNKKIDEENKKLSGASKQSQETLIQQSSPALNALSGQIAEAGGTFEDVMAQIAATNPGLAFALQTQGSNDLKKSFDNIKKSVDEAKAAFNAMNLGLQSVQGAASAAAMGVNNYIASQQAGNIPLEQSMATLQASVTSAAQGITNVDFNKALLDAEKTLRGFGADQGQIDINKFKNNLKAVNDVQKNSATVFADVKDQLSGDIRGAQSAEARKNAFQNVIAERLKAGGADKTTIESFKAATNKLTDQQLTDIGQGKFEVFEKAMEELGQETLKQVEGPLKARIEIEQKLNQLTKQRIEAENNLINAQKNAANIRMEAREIQSKYGGKVVTAKERSANLVEQANLTATGVKGITALKTGSASELAQRNKELSSRQSQLAEIRTKAASGDQAAQAQLAGRAGEELASEEKRLSETIAQQTQLQRDLIKVKEQELDIINAKNRLEEESMQSLISGDIEKFFEQQAAVGATAAIATGSSQLMGAYGPEALGGAYNDLKRQKEAGVQELYGMKLSGPGGLIEASAGASLAARGVTDPRMAALAAGNTQEAENVKSEIRAIAETMGPTADIQTMAANQQLEAAKMQFAAAQQQVTKAVQMTEMRGEAAVGRSMGGLIYASRGIFIPRGTDTIPAMLTPGEFVVRREAVGRGNNLQMLQAMNGGGSSGSSGMYATGGVVRYRDGGSENAESGGGFGFSLESLGKFAEALTNFNSRLESNINTLSQTKFQITLDTTNININFQGTSFLSDLTASVQDKLLGYVASEIKMYKVDMNGNLSRSERVI